MEAAENPARRDPAVLGEGMSIVTLPRQEGRRRFRNPWSQAQMGAPLVVQLRSILPHLAMCLKNQSRSVVWKVLQGCEYRAARVRRGHEYSPSLVHIFEKSTAHLAMDVRRRSPHALLLSELFSDLDPERPLPL